MGETKSLDIFNQVKQAADEQIGIMRNAANELFDGRTDLIIGVNGSIARREYTSGSDVDFFFLYTAGDPEEITSTKAKFTARLTELGLKMPSAGGVFEKAQPMERLWSPIGGQDDTNDLITKRMLFLLEGEWIFNERAFENARTELIQRYVHKNLEDSKLCLYLLNDIIRYWRTICIDFEHKTAAGAKPRGIRYIKLRFSRMLLCFAGMIAVAEAINKPVIDKRKELVRLFSIPALTRLSKILGPSFDNAYHLYGDFLTHIHNPELREKLESPNGESSPEFTAINEKATQFKTALVEILLEKYKGHAIVGAILL